MRTPHRDKLLYENHSINRIEIGWLFDGHKQFIFGIKKDGSVYIECGDVDENGNYISSESWYEFPSKSQITENDFLWNDLEYNFFSNGKDLYLLAEDVINYLN